MKDHEPSVRARELGLTLMRAAQAKGLTNRELSRRLGWSDSRVSRVFSGKRGCHPNDVAALLAVCGVKTPKREELVELSRRASERGWWQEYGDHLPPELITLTDYEDAAISIISFENAFIPGLLQTAAYAGAILRTSPLVPATELDEREEIRLRRQKIVDRLNPATFQFFIDETVLTRTGPGQEVMSDQVHHLLRMAVRPNVHIKIIPDSVGFHAARMPFKLMEFTELRPIVFIESQTSVLFLERPDTIDGYRRIVANLDNVALDKGNSRAWLANLARELGAPREEHDEHTPPMAEEFPE